MQWSQSVKLILDASILQISRSQLDDDSRDVRIFKHEDLKDTYRIGGRISRAIDGGKEERITRGADVRQTKARKSFIRLQRGGGWWTLAKRGDSSKAGPMNHDVSPMPGLRVPARSVERLHVYTSEQGREIFLAVEKRARFRLPEMFKTRTDIPKLKAAKCRRSIMPHRWQILLFNAKIWTVTSEHSHALLVSFD